MADVFVSYATPDRSRVAPIVEALEQAGWSVWWDRDISGGAAFDRAIEQAIDEARCIVVVWSEHSIDSEWVRTEANEGLERGVLVPVIVDAIRPPLAFRRTQTLDFTHGVTEDAVARLVNAVEVFAPRMEKPGAADHAMIGRDAELERVDGALTGASRGLGSCLLVSGEAGVGKTRLMREAVNRARSSNVLALLGHCSEMEGAPPYEPFVEHIEQTARTVDPVALRMALGDNAAEVAKLMPELRQLYTDIPVPIEMPPDQDRRYLMHGFAEFLQRAAETQPLMLVFEDLQWADASTCLMLRHLADRLREAGVLLIGSYRDTELVPGSPFARALQELVKERLCKQIQLKRLDQDDVEKLLATLAGSPPPDALVEVIYRETEGNPFFVEEVYRNLAESDRLFDDAGAFRARLDLTDVDLPPGVRLVLEQRLERVSDDCRKALVAAAVSGRRFRFELLGAIVELSEDALLDAMDEAESASLVEDVSTGREARYQFAHELIRQTLLSSLSFPRRQRLHLRIGNAIETLFGESRASEVAHHLYQAGAAADMDTTVGFLLRAARRSLASLAFEDALRQLDQALEVLGDTDMDRAAEIEILRARAMRGAARVEDALSALAGALRNRLSDAIYEELLLARARLLVDLFRGSDALPDIESLLARAQGRNDQQTELKAQLLLAEARYRISLDHPNAAEPAKEASERAIDLAREVGDPRALAAALLSSTHFVDYWKEFRPQGLKNLEEARQIGIELGDEDIQIDAETMSLRVNIFTPVQRQIQAEAVREKLESRRDPIRLNQHLFWMIVGTRNAGQLARCVEVCDEAIAVADQLGVPPIQYPTFKGMALVQLGRFDEAARAIAAEPNDEQYRFARALQAVGFLERKAILGAVDAVLAEAPALLEEARALQRAWMVDLLVNLVTRTAARDGRPDEARDLVDAGFDATRSKPNRTSLAEVELAKGNAERALELADADADMNEKRGSPIPRVESLEVGLRALAKLARWEELRNRADAVIPIADDGDYALLRWRLYALRGKAHAALGHAAQAQSDADEARRLFELTAETVEEPDFRAAYEAQSLPLLGV